MTTTLHRQSIQSFRGLLRTVNEVFRGDAQALVRCKTELRTQYRRNAKITDPQMIQKMIIEANEANDFLRSSIVQASLNTQGRYEMKLRSGMGETDNTIRVQDANTAKDSSQEHINPSASSGCGPSCGCGSK